MERRLHILLARDVHGTLLGVAPLQKVPLPIPCLGVLTFIGQETSLSPDFLVKSGLESEFCQAILDYISADRRLRGMVLKVAQPLTRGNPSPGAKLYFALWKRKNTALFPAA